MPSDEVLQDFQRALTPWVPTQKQVRIPQNLRDAVNQFVQPAVSALSEAGILALMNEAVNGFEQIPKLVDEVSFPGPPERIELLSDRAHANGSSWHLFIIA